MRAAPWVLSAVTLTACTITPQRTPDNASLGGSASSVMLHGDSRSLVFARKSEALLTFPPDGLALGVVDAIDDGTDYDPFPDGTPPSHPDGLRWLAVTDARLLAHDTTSFTLALLYEGGKQARLRVEQTSPGSFALTLTPAKDGPPVALFRLRAAVDSKEGFYGLGEYFDDVNHRGHVRAMQLEADGGATESGYNEAHVPIPLLIGTRGWGLFVESRYTGIFDVASKAPDRIEATFGTGAASKDGFVFHLFSADKALDITKLYYDVTGYPRVPARWALGPWRWRHDRDQANVEADAQAMRDLDLPHTGIWIDDGYATAVNSFDFDPARYKNAQAMIAKVHGLGFRIALWHTPYLDEKSGATAELRKQAKAQGFYPPVTSVPLNKWGPPIDFTNPDAYAWWQKLVRKYADLGIEGFKLDYGEDVAPTVGTGRNVWRFFDGRDERTMHAGYTFLYHQLYQETTPASGSFLLCRNGTWGDQINASIIWPGDLDSSFAKHKEPADKYVSVGGLPASIVAGLSLGPSGFPFYGSDTGGYRHSPPDKELLTRWFEQTALSTVMQIGNGASSVAWEKYPDTNFDDEMVSWYRVYTRLHLRLFPYEWTYAQNLKNDGRPITRALGLAYPELGVHPNDEYMFGDDLLVAPVVERGARSRNVVFPRGDWIDWWTGEVVTGGGAANVDAPLGKLPLYIRRGGIVPLLRPTIDAIAPTSSPADVDSYATTPGVLYPRIAAGADGKIVLFDDTKIEQRSSPRGMQIHVKDGAEFANGMFVEVLGLGARPGLVRIDGEAATEVGAASALELIASGFAFEKGSAFVKLPPGEHTVSFDLP